MSRIDAAPRLLFVSSTVTGGSGKSQRELARHLKHRGMEVEFLVDDGRRASGLRWISEQLLDASVRFESSTVGPLLDRARGRFGRRVESSNEGGLTQHSTVVPENAIDAVLDSGFDLVIGSSISRPSWQRVMASCRTRGIPAVLYLREETAVAHLRGSAPDLVLANSNSLVAAASTEGVHATYIPSVVEVKTPSVSTREVALLINPIGSHGVGVVDAFALSRPDIPLVLQESWQLTSAQRTIVNGLVDRHRSVSFRPWVDSSELFRDARVLLVPHQIDNRPRVVLEAQASGVIVFANDLPGLREAAGDAQTMIPIVADGAEWAEKVGRYWDDPEAMTILEAAGRLHAARSEVQPGQVVDEFIAALSPLLTGIGSSIGARG